MLEHALAYARRGWPVFPVARDKTPLTVHGFKDATTDEEVVHYWFGRKAGPRNIGLAIPEGLVVLDFDLRNGAPSPDLLGLPSTKTVVTPGGGHRYYSVPEGVELAAKWMAGVDVKRAGRGYVLLPPSNTDAGVYEWQDKRQKVVALPEWVLNNLRVQKTSTTIKTSTETAPAFSWDCGTEAGMQALKFMLGDLVLALAGSRNDTLNKAGFKVGKLVTQGQLTEDALDHVLRVALFIGLEKDEVLATLKGAYERGRSA